MKMYYIGVVYSLILVFLEFKQINNYNIYNVL